MMYTDKEIIKGIAQHNTAVLEYVYQEYFPYIESYVLRNGGNEEQVKDTFQDALIIVYRKTENDDFQLHCKFGTYLYAVCKKIWIQDRKKHQLRQEKLQDYIHVAESETEYPENENNYPREIMEKHLKKLSQDCQKMLRLFFNDVPIKEISSIMGINNVTHTTDKKYRCKKKLVDRIMADPEFRKYRNE